MRFVFEPKRFEGDALEVRLLECVEQLGRRMLEL